MCYNLVYMTKKSLDYARRLGASEEEISEFEQKLRELEELGGKPKFYHTNGFAHPDVPVITNKEPGQISFFEWGLIPGWVKDWNQATQLQKRTLNARGETIFDKPSFKYSALNKRCLVLVDGFFDFHSYNGKKYPFYIHRADGEPFTIAGLWETKTIGDITKNTFTIVTCVANQIMSKIHNDPKASAEPRMPVILDKENQSKWLMDINSNADKELIKSLIRPNDEVILEAYSVGPILGKNAIGNKPEVLERVLYEEIEYPV